MLDELDIDKVGIVAASAGAPVAYTFAARHPEKVWGLVSIGGVSIPKQGKASSSSIRTTFMNTIGQKLVRLTANISLRSIVEGTLSETSSFTSEQKAQRSAYIMDTSHVRTFFEAMLSTTFPYGRRTPGTDNDAAQARAMGALPFGHIKAPSLIIHGTQDADVSYSEGVYAYEHIPGARRYWMEHDDHLGFWLSPEADTAQEVARSFLLRHRPRGETLRGVTPARHQ